MKGTNLGEFEEKLDAKTFFRVHHSWIVQKAHIRKYVRGKGGYIVLSDDSHVNVSVRRKKEFIEWLEA